MKFEALFEEDCCEKVEFKLTVCRMKRAVSITKINTYCISDSDLDMSFPILASPRMDHLTRDVSLGLAFVTPTLLMGRILHSGTKNACIQVAPEIAPPCCLEI